MEIGTGAQVNLVVLGGGTGSKQVVDQRRVPAFGRETGKHRFQHETAVDNFAKSHAASLEKNRRHSAEVLSLCADDNRPTANTGFETDDAMDFQDAKRLTQGSTADAIVCLHLDFAGELAAGNHTLVADPRQDVLC